MTGPSASHVVIIPSYNTGRKLIDTVLEARRAWEPVWVVVDGSTDGSDEPVIRLAREDAGLRVLSLPRNQGKGSAILHGLREAERLGFTHALTMDADGQHPAACIPAFMAASVAAPDAMILCRPVFDTSAPRLRVRGRRISNGFVTVETLSGGIADSLCGFRAYPIAPLRAVMDSTRWMRRFDFDPEAVVRLFWRGVTPLNLPAPIRYLRAEEGGVSHFDYVRDNVLLTWMHTRLLIGFLFRFPALLLRRLSGGFA